MAELAWLAGVAAFIVAVFVLVWWQDRRDAITTTTTTTWRPIAQRSHVHPIRPPYDWADEA